jgi:hypothetical protein
LSESSNRLVLFAEAYNVALLRCQDVSPQVAPAACPRSIEIIQSSQK